MNSMQQHKPLVGVLMGDPSGVGPELVSQVLAKPEAPTARRVIIGDPEVLALGDERAGLRSEVQVVETLQEVDADNPATPFLAVPVTPFSSSDFAERRPNVPAGRYTMEVLQQALDLGRSREIDAVSYAPMSKVAMNMAGWKFRDGIDVCTRHLGFTGVASEINVLDDLWVARVTSHVPIRAVPDLVSIDRVVAVIGLLHRAMTAAGIEAPRIAVAGLNPHCGENGLCGTEEIDAIIPAITRAQAEGIDAVGPVSPDTIYLEARRHGYAGIVAMYHDQCQVANKLLQFDTGIAVHGGSPVPTVTVGHGTAYDIVGKKMASPRALERAIDIAGNICRNRGLYEAEPVAPSGETVALNR